MPLIELREVVKTFKTTAGDFQALKGINLTFEQGEFTSIMGKSGSGKSTLINMITGIDHPTAGSVRVGEAEIHRMSQGKMAEWRGRTLGIVFQFFQLLPTLSVLENTMLPMDYCNMYAPAEREGRAMELLKLMGLEGEADKLPLALSGGQQQIAAIARSLANDPPIIVADEPTGNLDSRTAEHVLAIFGELADQGKTILIVTHDPALARRSTRRVLISDGELVNEMIAQALHMLPHPQMLKLTRLAEARRYEPGVTIARQGALDQGLYIITSGQVEVLRPAAVWGRLSGKSAPAILGTIGPGGYFSELEMVETSFCDLSFRAWEQGPVEALCLSVDGFNRFLSESPSASQVLRHAAVEHGLQYCPLAEKRKR